MSAWLGLAGAQTAEAPDKRLDQARSTLDQIVASLARPTLSDANLQDLRGQLDPVAAMVDGVIAELAPRLAAIKSRLEQLAPKTADKIDKVPAEKPAETPAADPSTSENTAAMAERLDQEKSFKETDTTLRRARAMAVETEQTIRQIHERRRGLFTKALFEQSSSLFRPGLWLDVIGGLPGDFRAAKVVTGDWGAILASRLEGWRATVFFSILAVLLALIWPVMVVARRVLASRANGDAQSKLGRITAACLVALIVVSLPVAFLVAVIGILSGFTLHHAPVQPFFNTVAEGIGRVAVVAGLAMAVLRPSGPDWRLLPMQDATAQKLLRLAIVIAAIVSLAKLASAFADVIGSGLPLVVAVRGTGALLVALAIGQGLDVLGSGKREVVPGELTMWQRNVAGLIRLMAWILALGIIGAVLIGYIAFATFLIDQIVWIGCIGVSLFLLLQLAEESIPAMLAPGAPLGHFLSVSIGLQQDALRLVEIILTGACQLVLYGVATLLAIAPWGVQSDDFVGSLRTAFFGFKVGDVTISLSSIVVAVVLFALALGFTRAVQQWLDVRFLPHTKLDKGLRNSIKTSLGYVGFVFAASLALSNVGLSLERVAFVAGALSVGIGFGLQSIVNNFVSGLILLWEGTIRVGDWIVVGEDQGYVRRINVRSTEIETFERSMVIVPNSNLVSGVVKNWVRGDRIGRVKIVMALSTGADVHQIREILAATAKAHESVIKIPAPSVLFADMNEAGIKLELYCFVEEVEQAARVRSDLLFELRTKLEAAGMMGALASNGISQASIGQLLAAASARAV